MKNINPHFLAFALKAFGAIVFVIVVGTVISRCNESSLREEKKEQAMPVNVHHYLDDSGKKHTETTVVTVNTSAALNDFYTHIIDSISAVLHTQKKEVKTTEMIGTITAGDFKPVISVAPKPSVNGLSSSQESTVENKYAMVDFKDKYLTLHGNTNKDCIWHYSVTDSLIIVSYLKRKGWFGHQLFIDGTSINPNTTIKGMKSIAISGYQPHKWGIGVQIGYGFNGEKLSPMIAVGLQRSILRF